MVITDQEFTHPDQEVREIGLRALIDSLGYADTLRFLAQVSGGAGDSVIWQRELFADMSVDKLYERAKAYWDRREQGESE
jgi:hypothetical protein